MTQASVRIDRVSETFSILPLRASDRDAWGPLWDGYNEFYERVGPTALPAEVTETTWSRLLDPAEPVHGLVAELDGRVVGLAHYLFHRATTMVPDNCLLHDLYTVPEARGHGVARALIEAVYEAAAAAGSIRVYWQTHHTNSRGRALYDTVAESGFMVYRHDL
jgi:GNAT superfamily N-acetyltransferase